MKASSDILLDIVGDGGFSKVSNTICAEFDGIRARIVGPIICALLDDGAITLFEIYRAKGKRTIRG